MRWLRLGGAAILLLAAAVVAFAVGRPVQVLPRMAPAPPYSLFDPWGESVTAPKEGAPITLYTFGAARDEGGLAAVERVYREVGQALAGEGYAGDVAFAFITVDPDHDTPEVLQRVAQRLAAPPGFPTITFLTGPWVAIRLTVGTGFGVYYQPAPSGGNPDALANGPPYYEPVLVVVDGEHLIRARYPLSEVRPEAILRDVRLLQKEAMAEGATRWIYEGAHLFLCYPR